MLYSNYVDGEKFINYLDFEMTRFFYFLKLKFRFTIFFIIAIFPIFFISSVSGQIITKQLRGKVINTNFKPLIFASVYVKNTHYGCITNEDGEFLIHIPYDTEFITVSYVGYKTIVHKIGSNEEFHTIILEKQVNIIDEIEISAYSPESLLKKAIDKIHENYPNTPIILNTFYREKLYVNDSLEYFSEVQYDVVKEYSTKLPDKYYISRNRHFIFKKDSTIQIELYGGIIDDLLKNPEINFGNKLLKNHKLTINPATTFDDRDVYVVHIEPDMQNVKNGIQGDFFVDKKTFAFLKISIEYLYNNHNKYNLKKIRYDAHYRFTGKKCYPVSFYKKTEKYFKQNGFDYRGNSEQILLTTGIENYSEENVRNKILFRRGNSLTFYASENDTNYWANINHILPDKEVNTELKRLKIVTHGNPESLKEYSVVKANAENREKNKIEIYHPNITVFFSNQSFSNLSAFNETYMGFSTLANYYTYNLKEKFKYGGLTMPFLFMYLSFPFQAVEVERELLAKNNIPVKYMPTSINRYLSPYCYGLTNQVINDFKNRKYNDFMRLHTIKKDANYLSIMQIEELLAISDLKNKAILRDYFRSYYFELFSRRLFSINFLSKLDIILNESPRNEKKMALIEDRSKSFVKYLFNPEEPFQRNITSKELTDNEKKYLTKSLLYSTLNFISPQMLGIKPFTLSENLRATFATNYLLVPFG